MSRETWPQPLEPLRAPIAREFVERVVASLGPCAGPSPRLVTRGIVPPCALVGINLALIVSQPRAPRPDGTPAPNGVAGGVWVRERVTIHRAPALDEELLTQGGAVRRYVRKGRRYNTTLSETRNAAGQLVVTTETTGLSRYKPDEALADSEEGLAEDAVAHPVPDRSTAAENPAADRLRALRLGDSWSGNDVHMTLERLVARDGARARNPIHTDPAAARAAGLDRPIAGGSHVLAFAQELVLERLGDDALSHGSYTDVRWLTPVKAGERLRSTVAVVGVHDGVLDLALESTHSGGIAMRAIVRIPTR